MLKKHNIQNPQKDAEILLLHLLKKPKEFLYAHPDDKISPKTETRYNAFLKRRINHEPVAYILNKEEFYGLEFFVNRDVLIPRPETELLIDQTIKILSKNTPGHVPAILDLGTGSGCLAITLAVLLAQKQSTLKACPIFALDLSQKALKIARKNAKKHKVIKKIKFLQSDLLDGLLKNKVHEKTLQKINNLIILANLPYVSKKEYKNLPLDIKNFEPKKALIAGKDGLKYYKKLFPQISRLMQKNKISKTFLIIEITPSQAKKIKDLIQKTFPISKIEIKKDYAELERVVVMEIG